MIAIREVCKAFDRTTVLDHFSLEVSSAERVAVLGPSGCGKTTLLRLVAGLELPDQGEIWLGRQPASRPGWALAPHQRGIGMVFQQPALFPHMSVAENICFGCADLPRAEKNSRLALLLERLGLNGLAGRFPHQLSGGEARRVGLARALAPRSKILLLDEPFTNLNRELKQYVLEVMLEHLEMVRPALLLVTHEPAEATLLADRMVELPGKEAE